MKHLLSAFALVALLAAGVPLAGCTEETEVETVEEVELEPMPEPAPMPMDSIHMGLTDTTGASM